MVAWSGPPHAHHCWSYEGEADAASYPSHRGRIVLIILLADQRCKAFVEDLSSGAHATSCREHQGRECAMLYLTDSLFIFPPLLLLMLAVACSWWGETVAGCVWVEHPNVKEGILPSLSPEATGSDVQPCIVLTRVETGRIELSKQKCALYRRQWYPSFHARTRQCVENVYDIFHILSSSSFNYSNSNSSSPDAVAHERWGVWKRYNHRTARISTHCIPLYLSFLGYAFTASVKWNGGNWCFKWPPPAHTVEYLKRFLSILLESIR